MVIRCIVNINYVPGDHQADDGPAHGNNRSTGDIAT